MDSTPDIKPKLSVIVPGLRGYRSVLAAVNAWEAQTCRDQLEILVLCPSTEDAGPLTPAQFVVAIGSLDLHEARALGIRQSTGDYVLIAEDHCIPDPSCAEAILSRLEENWDAVGPALRSGNPISSWTQASFLLGYGQWMSPVPSGIVAVLPGHNAVFRRKALLELGDDLAHELLVAAFLFPRLRRENFRLYLESKATMRHYDIADRMRCVRIFAAVGLGFGARRTEPWSWPARAIYALAIPAIAARHWLRAHSQYRRAGVEAGLSPACLLAAWVLGLAWACGESAGALLGVSRVTPFVSFSEIKPVALADVQEDAKVIPGTRRSSLPAA